VTERSATAEVRAGELETRVADLNKKLEQVHDDLGAECERATADRQRLEAERDSAWQEAQREALSRVGSLANWRRSRQG
jgi:hypothetical protein